MHATTHSAPTCLYNNIIHYRVANIPGAVPHTSTLALTNATFPYIEKIASCTTNNLLSDPLFIGGINTYEGQLFCPDINFSLLIVGKTFSSQ
jgi:alanine dehydrogenase